MTDPVSADKIGNAYFRYFLENGINLQNFLMILNQDNFEQIYAVLSTGHYLKDRVYFHKFYKYLSHAAQSNYHQRHLYLELLNRFQEQAMESLSPYSANSIHYPFIAFFLKLGIMKPWNIFECMRCGVIRNEMRDLLFFYPEIGRPYKTAILQSMGESANAFIEFCEQDYEKFNENRIQGKNLDPLALIIQQDDLEQFKALRKSFPALIPYSVYESGPLVSSPAVRPSQVCYAAYYAAERIFFYLYDELNVTDPHLLEFAVYGNNEAILHAIFEKDPPKFTYYHFVFALSHWRNRISQMLLPSVGTVTRNQALLLCLQNFNLDLFEEFVYRKHQSSIQTGNELTKLFKLYCKHCTQVPEFLTLFRLNKIDFDQVDENGQTVAHYIAKSGAVLLFSYLRRQLFFKINDLDSYGMTPLMYAITNQHSLMVQYLLTSTALDINTVGRLGSAIFYAIQSRNTKIFHIICSHSKIDLTIRNSDNLNPKEFAEACSNEVAIEYFASI